MPDEKVSIIIRAKDLASDVFRKVSAGLKSIGVSVRGLTQATGAVLAGTTGLTFLAKKLFDTGSAVLETRSKFVTAFGDSSKALDAFLKDFAPLAGLTESAAQGLTATSGSILQGMGIAQDASAGLSRQILQLGADLASYNNLQGGTAEGVEILNSALTGEFERLKRVGVVLRAADVDQRALANTGKKLVSELTEQERVLARLQLAQERAGKAVGDLERTSDSAANRARQLGAQFRSMWEDLSVRLLPALAEFLPVVQNIGEAAATAVPKLAAFAQTLLDALGVSSASFREEQRAIRELGDDTEGLDRRAKQLRREIGLLHAEIERLQPTADRDALGVNPADAAQARIRIAALTKEVDGLVLALDAVETKSAAIKRLAVASSTGTGTTGTPAPGASPRAAAGGGGLLEAFQIPTPGLSRVDQRLRTPREGAARVLESLGFSGLGDEVRGEIAKTFGELKDGALNFQKVDLPGELRAAAAQSEVLGTTLAAGLGQLVHSIVSAARGGGGFLGGLLGGVGSILGAIPGLGLPAVLLGQAAGIVSALASGGRDRPTSVHVASFGPQARRDLERHAGPERVTVNILDDRGNVLRTVTQTRRVERRRGVSILVPGAPIPT